MTTSVGISELNQSNDETKTTGIVTYGDKAAQIELEGLAALFAPRASARVGPSRDASID